MNQFFLANLKPTPQPVKSDSQPNDSNELILFSESKKHSSYWLHTLHYM